MANSVRLILLEDVENLGLAGTEVTVAPGYARNYLLPRNLAAKATAGTLRLLAARQEKIEQRRAAELAAAKELAAKLAEVSVLITAQASNDDQLFGSVSARAIAEQLAAQDLKIDYNKIKIESPIKLLGDYEVPVRLHSEVSALVKVKVERA